MKKYILILLVLLLLSISIDSLAQSLAFGTVIDSQTKNPIESVYIQNRNQQGKTAMANDGGYFSISANLSDTLYFIRIGYNSEYFVYKNGDSLQIELTPKEYDLSEVTVTNEDAYELVRKAFFNLKSQYSSIPADYLWHGSLFDINKAEKNESYALYSALFNKENFSKDEMLFDLHLIDLGHLSNNFQTSKNEGLIVNMQYHSFLLEWPKLPEDYKLFRVNSENDSLIMIKCIPLLKSKSVPLEIDMIINKSDTILLHYHTLLYNEYEKEIKLLGAKVGTVKLLEKNIVINIKRTANN
jgi:hypothetical protein